MTQTLDCQTMDNSVMETAVSDEPVTPQPDKPLPVPGRPKGKMPKLPSEEKPKKPKTWADDILAYHRKYYKEKLRYACSCEICGREFASICGYKRHKKDCKSCKIIQQIREESKKRNLEVLDLMCKYKAGDSMGDLLYKVISL